MVGVMVGVRFSVE